MHRVLMEIKAEEVEPGKIRLSRDKYKKYLADGGYNRPTKDQENLNVLRNIRDYYCRDLDEEFRNVVEKYIGNLEKRVEGNKKDNSLETPRIIFHELMKYDSVEFV